MSGKRSGGKQLLLTVRADANIELSERKSTICSSVDVLHPPRGHPPAYSLWKEWQLGRVVAAVAPSERQEFWQVLGPFSR
jgi:hypothetical protein